LAVIVGVPTVAAEKVTSQKPPKLPNGVSGQVDGVNVPVTPVTVNETVPVGALPVAETATWHV